MVNEGCKWTVCFTAEMGNLWQPDVVGLQLPSSLTICHADGCWEFNNVWRITGSASLFYLKAEYSHFSLRSKNTFWTKVSPCPRHLYSNWYLAVRVSSSSASVPVCNNCSYRPPKCRSSQYVLQYLLTKYFVTFSKTSLLCLLCMFLITPRLTTCMCTVLYF